MNSMLHEYEGTRQAWGFYAAAGIARDGWRIQKNLVKRDEYDGLDKRGSSDSRARCWSYIRFDDDTSDFDIS